MLKGVYRFPEFILIVSTPKHFSLTIISWEKALRIKERLLNVQSGHQESLSAWMKNSMISSFCQPLFGKKPAYWHFYFRRRWTRFIPTVGFSQVVEKSWSISGIYKVRFQFQQAYWEKMRLNLFSYSFDPTFLGKSFQSLFKMACSLASFRSNF